MRYRMLGSSGGEPIDADLLADVEAILEPVRDVGWISGRPENQDPGRAP